MTDVTPTGERRLATVRALLGQFTPGRVADLGTGHGLFASAAADMGWNVDGIDARTGRWPDDERVNWVEADVRTHDLSGYDVVMCLGLFYHLTFDDQVDLLRRVSGRPLILDTHVDHGTHKHEASLSRRIKVATGYEGRTYREPKLSTSAWGNPRSFWPTLATLHRMLADSGYHVVLTLEPWILPDRTFFLALP